MELQKGDWVRTVSGAEGRVVHVSRLTAFVEIPTNGKEGTLVGYLMSQLTKIEPPTINDAN